MATGFRYTNHSDCRNGTACKSRAIAQRVERALREGREQPALSVGVGISIYPEDGQTAPELLQAADRHLYQRKKAAHSQGMSAH